MEGERNVESRLPSTACDVGLGLRFEFLEEVVTRLDGGERLPVDFFEVAPENFMRRGGFVPASLARIARDYPIVSHGLTLSVGGLTPLDATYLETLRTFLDTIGATDHSDHLCFSEAEGVPLHDLFPVPHDTATLRHVASRTREVQDHIGRRLLLENISYYFPIVLGDLPEPELFTALVRESGCGVLLDVNNVHVNAKNHGIEALDFVARMPLDAVSTVHVAGHQKNATLDLLVDTHGAPVCPEVLDLLRFAVERTGPVRVVLERDNDVPALDVLLEEVAVVRATCVDGLARRAASTSRDLVRAGGHAVGLVPW